MAGRRSAVCCIFVMYVRNPHPDLPHCGAATPIDQAAAREGVTMAELIRRALDDYLGDDVDASTALAATFGAEPSASVPSRDEWPRG